VPEPLYVVGPSEGELPAAVASLEGVTLVAPSLEALGPLEALAPGLILIVADGAEAEPALLGAAHHVSRSDGWRLALLDAGAGTCRSLTLGPLRPIAEALRARTHPTENGVALDQKSALAEMAKVRHELNNHLTAALAETQLLLMDVTNDELEESYEMIQEQLRKMREAIASTARFTSKA